MESGNCQSHWILGGRKKTPCQKIFFQFGPINPNLKKIMGKIKIFSIHNLLRRNFEYCWKITTSTISLLFKIHNAAVNTC